MFTDIFLTEKGKVRQSYDPMIFQQEHLDQICTTSAPSIMLNYRIQFVLSAMQKAITFFFFFLESGLALSVVENFAGSET